MTPAAAANGADPSPGIGGPGMGGDFLRRYLSVFGNLPGWFSPDAYMIFAAYHQLLADGSLAGDVLEIGVHHGLSAIGLAALRGEGRRFVVIDLFDDLQSQNVSKSGLGNRERFTRNMARFHPDLSFLTMIASPSGLIDPKTLGAGFSFCHVDGGHSAPEVYADLQLCAAVAAPGALIALDDYFNPAFPGVGEAAVRFGLEHAGVLQPIAIGFNKALFQRTPAPFALNDCFAAAFPQVLSSRAELWGVPVPLFDAAFAAFFDPDRSTPRRLVPVAGGAVAARIEPQRARIVADTGTTVDVAVQVTNLSRMPLARGSSPFGLSYHLLTADRRLLEFDHPRTWFDEPLLPGGSRTVIVPVRVPDAPGPYQLEFDVVWEGVSWMKDRGNPTGLVDLSAVAASTADAPASAEAPVA